MSELRDKVTELSNKTHSTRDKMKIFNVQSNAEILQRELSQSPNRKVPSRDMER
jgi:hypothetical protein